MRFIFFTLATFLYFSAYSQSDHHAMNFQDRADRLVALSKKEIDSKNYGQAIKYLTKAKKIKGIEKNQVGKILAQRGRIYFLQKNFEYAVADFEQAFSFNVSDWETLELKAQAWFYLNNCLEFNKDYSVLLSEFSHKLSTESKKMALKCKNTNDSNTLTPQ